MDIRKNLFPEREVRNCKKLLNKIDSASLEVFTKCMDLLLGEITSGGPGSAELKVGFCDLRGLFNLSDSDFSLEGSNLKARCAHSCWNSCCPWDVVGLFLVLPPRAVSSSQASQTLRNPQKVQKIFDQQLENSEWAICD